MALKEKSGNIFKGVYMNPDWFCNGNDHWDDDFDDDSDGDDGDGDDDDGDDDDGDDDDGDVG